MPVTWPEVGAKANDQWRNIDAQIWRALGHASVNDSKGSGMRDAGSENLFTIRIDIYRDFASINDRGNCVKALNQTGCYAFDGELAAINGFSKRDQPPHG
jgi:hypothetical protein